MSEMLALCLYCHACACVRVVCTYECAFVCVFSVVLWDMCLEHHLKINSYSLINTVNIASLLKNLVLF